MRTSAAAFAVLTLTMTLLAGCHCGSSDGPRDATLDGCCSCSCVETREDRACIEAGPFWFGVVADELLATCSVEPADCPRYYAEVEDDLRARGLLARERDLPAYAIDVTEVSVADYAELVAAGGAPPPERCENALANWPECVSQVSLTGWSAAGDPPLDRGDEPVTCVTREQAEAYCAFRGGRLPTVAEWMKAARGPLPSRRHVPWSEASFAYDYGHEIEGWEGCLETFDTALVGVELEDCSRQQCVVRPYAVESLPAHASPYGVLHMLSNVAEWVQFDDSASGYREQAIDIVGIWPRSNGSTLATYTLPAGGLSGGLASSVVFDGGVRRDRWLGFRCAYDLSPE